MAKSIIPESTDRRRPGPILRGPPDLYRLMQPYVDGLKQEHAFGIYVSRHHAVLAVDLLSAGTRVGVALAARDVYAPAFRHQAAALALCHNHPDGDPYPSPRDRLFTHRVASIGRDLDIPLLDHLITGADTYHSLRQFAVEKQALNPFGPTVTYNTRWPRLDLAPYLGESANDTSDTDTDPDVVDSPAPPLEIPTAENQAGDLEARVGYRVTALERHTVADARPRINGPDDLYRLIAPYVTDADREHFYGIYLTTKNHLLAVELVSLGSLSASIVHPREVYKPALLHSAASLAVAHNHPSGDPEPSAEDIDFTRRLAKAGELLGIKLLDHLILGTDDYVSLKERESF